MKNLTIDDLIDMGTQTLPEGWIIRIEFENGAAWVTAVRPGGSEIDIRTDEADMGELVRDAIQLAFDENSMDKKFATKEIKNV